MSKTMQARRMILPIWVLSVILAACGANPKPVVETFTEAEFNEQLALEAEGFAVDLQPDAIVIAGETMGAIVSVEMAVTVEGSELLIEVTNVTVDDEPVPLELFEELGTELSTSFYSPEEGYVLESVEITDDDITFVSVPE